MKMKVVILLSLIGASLANTIKDEVVQASYLDSLAAEGLVKMNIHLNRAEETIRFHMHEEGNMADVETLEDYDSGFAASRVKDEESCFIRQLLDTYDQAHEKAHEVAATSPQRKEGDVDVKAIPAENAIEWAGERLMDFCGDYEVYKLVQTAEDAEDEETGLEQKEARISVFFRRCWFFLFFFRCLTTTITVPTGTIFFFFG
ncbi:unnamed protein product [Meganyctiphanes norvegica]|uniref:BRICHOS domain-containing protein n=1 Tax=Meganyctiphanes norvegica TaxID=48144 RepID=A0AAV2Q409_MEGNR